MDINFLNPLFERIKKKNALYKVVKLYLIASTLLLISIGTQTRWLITEDFAASVLFINILLYVLLRTYRNVCVSTYYNFFRSNLNYPLLISERTFNVSNITIIGEQIRIDLMNVKTNVKKTMYFNAIELIAFPIKNELIHYFTYKGNDVYLLSTGIPLNQKSINSLKPLFNKRGKFIVDNKFSTIGIGRTHFTDSAKILGSNYISYRGYFFFWIRYQDYEQEDLVEGVIKMAVRENNQNNGEGEVPVWLKNMIYKEDILNQKEAWVSMLKNSSIYDFIDDITKNQLCLSYWILGPFLSRCPVRIYGDLIGLKKYRRRLC